jgi:cyclase
MPSIGTSVLLFTGLVSLVPSPSAKAPAVRPAPTPRHVTQVATGVYFIEHEDDEDGAIASGNTTVIIGARQVLVVDACFLPAAARADITQIRQWTDKPVAFVVNTHFHNDHNLGNSAYGDAFPGVTFIAQAETKQDMDRFGPGSLRRLQAGTTRVQQMVDSGKTPSGRQLTPEERQQLRDVLARRAAAAADIAKHPFQSATLTFTDSLTIDLGGREVRVEFLGRGNTSGDAIVYLPREKVVVIGDLVVDPIPYIYDGYPSEWVGTLERLSRMDAETFLPGHGSIMHDRHFLTLTHDLYLSAVTQLNAALVQVGPAMFHKVEDVRGQIDLTSFRTRFAGADADVGGAFDAMVEDLIRAAFDEARLR